MDGSEVEAGAEEERSQRQPRREPRPCPAPSRIQSTRSFFLPRGNLALSLGFTTNCRGSGPKLSVLPPREMQEILSGTNLYEEENPSESSTEGWGKPRYFCHLFLFADAISGVFWLVTPPGWDGAQGIPKAGAGGDSLPWMGHPELLWSQSLT